MKKKILTFVLLLTATVVMAKDIKTLVVTTLPQMHCENCEKKIKGNLRFEKGITKIETDREGQRVTITYDADKTTPAEIIAGFQKFGYKATELKKPEERKPAVDANTGATTRN
ncbi:MAG: cation transporter [Prevotella sp.]|nr:cation transporter [Prevotella sp.]